MSQSISEKPNLLLRGVLDRLENTPIEFVEAFIDLLAAPDRKRNDALFRDLLVQVWLALAHPEVFVQSFNLNNDLGDWSRTTYTAPYDFLIQLLRVQIETEITANWKAAKQSEYPHLNNRTLQLFWGGLTLHIKLLLPLDPCCGPQLFSNSMLRLSNGDSFPCEAPLGESQIYELITHLGSAFVDEYASSYIQQEKLRTLILRLNPVGSQKGDARLTKDFAPTVLLVQERSLNRYVDKFAKRIAVHFHADCVRVAQNPSGRLINLLTFSSLDSAFAQIMTEATSALFLEPYKVKVLQSTKLVETSAGHQEIMADEASTQKPRADSELLTGVGQCNPKTFNHNSPDVLLPTAMTEQFTFREVLGNVRRVQEKLILDSIRSVFVPQNLEYTNLRNTEIHPVNVADLASSTNQRLVLVAPPGGGKTRLQQEILICARDSQIFHLWIDLRKFSFSGFRSFHQFAAHQFLNLLSENQGSRSAFANKITAFDSDQKIYWHLDGWDEISKSDLPSIVVAIAELPQFSLTCSNPGLALDIFKTQGLVLNGVLNIQAITQEQVAVFINANLKMHLADQLKAQRRVLQMPGLARLPGGLEYICANLQCETILDILQGYINRNLASISEPVTNPNEFVFDNFKEIEWQSDFLTAAYLIVKAILGHPKRTPNDLCRIETDYILPYMGASNLEQNRQLAIGKIESAIRGKFLQVIDNGRTFRFVVPEIGYLLAAIALLSRQHGRRWLERALIDFQSYPHDPIHQMTLALGAWHQEKLFQRDLAVSTVKGTTVPEKMDTQLRFHNTVRAQAQT